MYKVLVIEDEMLTRRGLILTIPWNHHKCEVIGEASDGLQGIELAESLQPDIIITDINMPGMDGLTMIEKLRESTGAEFVIFSGYGQFEYAKKAIQLGVHGYLLKPVDDDEFLKVLDETVEAIEKMRRYEKMQEELERLDQKEAYRLLSSMHVDGESSCRDQQVMHALEYIKDHYSEEMTVRSAAESLEMSESHLGKLFHANTGYTFLEYLTIYRIGKAMELLSVQGKKTYEAAYLVGYQDTKYFSRLFKKITGVTPSEYKNR